jgi:hypothetical protein
MSEYILFKLVFDEGKAASLSARQSLLVTKSLLLSTGMHMCLSKGLYTQAQFMTTVVATAFENRQRFIFK